MAWQRAGTVSVQTGSTTVTGKNLDFAASSRVGDSFIGPDGSSYEVSNVASATVISILPAYKGATTAAGTYAIMPVQGYDKLLSDAFNNLNNQFGPKLAALGTTGNYDVLPVLSGGNGGVAGQLIPGANANSATLGNGSYITDSEWVGSPFAGSTPFNQGYLDMNWWGPGFAVQTWTSLGSVSTASGRGPLRRWLYNGTFGAWGSPDLAYTPANSVGAVSQAAGVPTGALMQYLSTVNGECWRFASGLQICTISVTTGAVNLAAGSVFTCAAQAVGGFPANFIVAPKVTPLGVVVGSGGGWGSCYSFPTASSWGAWAVYNHLSNSGPSRIDLIAVGRWF